MAYTKTTWEDLPSEDTPITSANLQKIEDGIEALDTSKVNKADIVDNLTTNDATKSIVCETRKRGVKRQSVSNNVWWKRKCTWISDRRNRIFWHIKQRNHSIYGVCNAERREQ